MKMCRQKFFLQVRKDSFLFAHLQNFQKFLFRFREEILVVIGLYDWVSVAHTFQQVQNSDRDELRMEMHEVA